MPDRTPWAAPRASHPISAQVAVPGSKSLTNRYLVLAALAGEDSLLRAPLVSRDTVLMAGAIESLGAQVQARTSAGEPTDWRIVPAALDRPFARIDCGLAGTVMRFIPPVAALNCGLTDLDGDVQARRRPLGPVIDALRALGVQLESSPAGGLPVRIHGTGSVRGGAVTIDASASSQFVSGLLLAGARFDQGLTVHHVGKPVPSEPHIAMTLEALRDAGVDVDESEPNSWRVEPGEINGLDVVVEPDLTNAATFLAAALAAGGSVTVPRWPLETTQAGDAIRDILDAMGAQVVTSREALTVTGDGTVTGIDIDLHDASELTPVVAALAALADSPTWIRGVGHIRGHETDRLAALHTELSALGADIEQTDDGLRIRPAPLHAGRFDTYADHRMVMAGAILGLVVPGVELADIECVGKTLPEFEAMWRAMLGGEG